MVELYPSYLAPSMYSGFLLYYSLRSRSHGLGVCVLVWVLKDCDFRASCVVSLDMDSELSRAGLHSSRLSML